MFKSFLFILSIMILGAGVIYVTAFDYLYSSSNTGSQTIAPTSFKDSSDLFLSANRNINLDMDNDLQKNKSIHVDTISTQN